MGIVFLKTGEGKGCKQKVEYGRRRSSNEGRVRKKSIAFLKISNVDDNILRID